MSPSSGLKWQCGESEGLYGVAGREVWRKGPIWTEWGTDWAGPMGRLQAGISGAGVGEGRRGEVSPFQGPWDGVIPWWETVWDGVIPWRETVTHQGITTSHGPWKGLTLSLIPFPAPPPLTSAWNLPIVTSALTMETVRFSETMASTSQSTLCQNPEEHHHHHHHY
jgi:hypothetical protein